MYKFVRFSGLITRSMSTLPLIRPSASLIIAVPTPLENNESGGSNYHIFMMKRNAKSSFVNAHVFPGGIVDKADHYSDWSQLVVQQSEKENHILTNKICAIRETFEESGLLLSDPPAHTIKALDLNIWRHKVHDDASQFKIMCDQFGIRPAVDVLVPFSNWITPEHEKKRYDTLFFITVLTQYKTKEQHDLYYHNLVAADGKETVLFDWFKPEQAIQKQKAKDILMMPPQWYTMTLMSQVPHFKDLISKAGLGAFRTITTNEIITILPQSHSVQDEEGFNNYLAYPGDEVYVSKKYVSKRGNRHRLYFKGKMQEFKLSKNIHVDTRNTWNL